MARTHAIDPGRRKRPEIDGIAEQSDGLAIARKMRSAGVEALMVVAPTGRILSWNIDRMLARRHGASTGTVPSQAGPAAPNA